MTNNIQLDVQDILNDLKDKITDAEMRATYAKAETKAIARAYEQLEQEVVALRAKLEPTSKVARNGHEVIDAAEVGSK